MKNHRTTPLILTCGILSVLLMMSTVARGQASGLLGTEFWTAFPNHSAANMDPPKRLVFQLLFLPLHDCDAVISHAPTTFTPSPISPVPVYPDTTLLHLRADSAVFLTLPNDGLVSDSYLPVPQGIHVSSTDSIALYLFVNTIDADTITDFESGEFEMTPVWPVDKLGCDYYANIYQSLLLRNSEILAVAAEDSLHLVVAPSPDGQSPQQEHILRLGEVLRVRHPSASGRHIYSPTGQHFALLTDIATVYIPNDVFSADQIFASQPPVNYWGSQFLLALSPARLNDRVRLVSRSDNCRVTLDGDSLTTLMQGDTYEFEIDTGRVASLLESSAPISVCVYLTGFDIGCADSLRNTPGSYSGDPSMYPLCPVEQWYSKSLFYSYDAPYHVRLVLGLPVMTFYPHYFLGVSVRTAHLSEMLLDGHPIDTAFRPLPYNPDFSYARLRITGGTHKLENSLGPFEAHAVTLKNCSAIAVATGWAATESPLSTHDTAEHCQDEDVIFSLNSATAPLWDFGDGTTGQGSPILHAYADSGTYTLTALYQRTLCQHFQDTLTMLVTIHPTQDTDFYDTIPYNQSYTWQGQTFTASGDYPAHFSTTYGCDSLVTLHLTISDSPDTPPNPDTTDHSDTISFPDTATLFIPNVFTPDRETNNRFYVFGQGIQDFDLTLFSRWGNIIFHTNDFSAQWDGTYKGQPCPAGAYTYLIRYTTRSCPYDHRTCLGQVTLLR